mgnify:CR=1 FL=1
MMECEEDDEFVKEFESLMKTEGKEYIKFFARKNCWLEIETFVKNRFFCQKSSFLSNIETLVKNRNICHQSKPSFSHLVADKVAKHAFYPF